MSQHLLLTQSSVLALLTWFAEKVEGESYHEKFLYWRTQWESKCSKGRLTQEWAAVNFEENKFDSLRQPLTFWSHINRGQGTVKLNGWHAERETSVGYVFHLAQLLRCQEKIKWTGDGHIATSLKMWIYFHMQLKHNVKSIGAEAFLTPKSWDKQGPAFLIYKEFKTHVKISIQYLNYFLDAGLTLLSFFYS